MQSARQCGRIHSPVTSLQQSFHTFSNLCTLTTRLLIVNEVAQVVDGHLLEIGDFVDDAPLVVVVRQMAHCAQTVCAEKPAISVCHNRLRHKWIRQVVESRKTYEIVKCLKYLTIFYPSHVLAPGSRQRRASSLALPSSPLSVLFHPLPRPHASASIVPDSPCSRRLLFARTDVDNCRVVLLFNP